MGQTDEKDDEVPELDDLDPSSGTRKKSDAGDLKLMVASLRQRTQGLDGQDLEDEIAIFMNKMIERAVRIAPESMRAEGRALLQSMVENDPTLKEMLDDLRRGVKKTE